MSPCSNKRHRHRKRAKRLRKPNHGPVYLTVYFPVVRAVCARTCNSPIRTTWIQALVLLHWLTLWNRNAKQSTTISCTASLIQIVHTKFLSRVAVFCAHHHRYFHRSFVNFISIHSFIHITFNWSYKSNKPSFVAIAWNSHLHFIDALKKKMRLAIQRFNYRNCIVEFK